MSSLRYYVVDVFTETPFGGNPLAVFPNAENVPDALQQAIAKELNLSETTFVSPPRSGGVAKVRIYTPATELPFAGHPTLGTAFVLARLGRWPGGRGVLELGVGPVEVTLRLVDDHSGFVEMEQRPPTFGKKADAAQAAALLSIPESRVASELPVQSVSCGSPFAIVPIRNLDTMHALRPRTDLWSIDPLGVGTSAVMAYCPEAETSQARVHARMFAPWLGVVEDPATGSAAGPLGCYLVHHGVVNSEPEGMTHFAIEQGLELRRPSFLHVTLERRAGEIARVAVGGFCVSVGQGDLDARLLET